jgi:hypothetical protein
MSYINIDDSNFINDINNRKELIDNLIDNTNNNDNYYVDNLIKENNKLVLNNYQRFITNFINPNTKYDKLLLVHSTGVGKTITSLSVAMNFIDIFKQNKNINKNDNTGMVYIIGFTKSVFKKELFTRSEFGIVTQREIDEMNQIKKNIALYNLDKDVQFLKDLKIRYSQRLRSKKGNGYFEFIGYKELVNKLIVKTNINNKIQFADIKDEKELEYYLEKNLVKLNIQFLELFTNSLIICDEIHNVYNSLNINNWGLCLRIIFKYHEKQKSLRVLLLSATPINNKPIEIISLLNLLNTDKYINKNEIFDKNNKIIPNGYNLIKKSINGKISYLKDMDLALYPSNEIKGDKIEGINYLKFIKCPMSDLHFKTYDYVSKNYSKNKDIEIINEKDNENEEDEINIDKEEITSIISNLKEYPINLELNNRYLNDIVFPNPDNKNLGLYIKADIIKNISNATRTWKDKNEIDIIKNDKILKNTLTGNFLELSNIKKYSTKYYELLLTIKNIILDDKGKIFIYHNFVQISGVNLIQEILKMNGILNMNDIPTKYSKCNICYDFKYNHDLKKIKHEFEAIRFITVSSLYSKNSIDKELDQFNLDGNAKGTNIRIILGSKAIKESYNLKAIQNIIVLHQPDNISTLIQIFGRAIRKNSHMLLPEINKKVNIYILVSTLPVFIQKKYKKYIYSYEEIKYKFKVDTYKIIQKINNLFIENAIDLNINYNINFPDKLSNNKDDLYYIEPVNKNQLLKINYNKLNLSTFNTYYYNNEINICKYMIKRLFIEESNIWTFEDLYKRILNPYFKMNFNTSLISKNSFLIALDFLVYKKDNLIYTNADNIEFNLIDNLFNGNNKFITDLNNTINVLIYIDQYYILIPYNNINQGNIYDNIDYDVDVLYRNYNKPNDQKINLNNLLTTDFKLNDYENNKKYLISKYGKVKIEDLLEIIYEFDYDFHLKLIEEIIAYFFKIYIDETVIKNINHDFYFKLLYFYNKFNIIIFANKLDKDLSEIYNKYIISTKIMNYTVSNDENENYNYNNLISSLENENENIKLEDNKLYFNFYNHALNESQHYLTKKNKKLKIFDYLLPIGHIFDKDFKFFHPSGNWFTKINFNKININYTDNDLIIGYLEKNTIGFDIIFKLRKSNAYTNKLKDMRQLESGLNCLFKDKSDLIDICKKLDIKLDKIKLRKNTLCDLIKLNLIKREIDERKKNSNIKYFYFYWEL